MARTPSMTTQEAEAILGPRAGFIITGDTRPTVKKWLCALGYNAAFIAGLSGIELQNAYRGQAGIDAVERKWRKAKEDTPGLDLEAPPVPAPADAQNAPAPTPAPPGPLPPQDDIARTLRELILGGWTPPASIDADAVRDIVRQELAGVAPRELHIHRDDKPPVVIDGLTHPQFDRVLKYLLAIGPDNYKTNVLLVGPAGCGKTYLAQQLAKAIGVRFGMISGSAGVSESALQGWLLPSEGGRFDYAASEFVDLYETGNALWLFDEIDGFDPNMLMCANVPLANGHMQVPIRREKPRVARGENVYFVATANTFGTGADPIYCGRNPLDEATRDRFIIISVDYDKRLEEKIGLAGGLTAAEMAGIWELRDKSREAQLPRVISTRAFQKAAIMKQCGDSWREIRDRLLEGWSRDERAKVGA